MKCPVCNIDLLMAVRKEVEIDYCPTCRGIWLDRGELDKILERSAGEFQPETHSRNAKEYRGHDNDHDNHDNRHKEHRDDDHDSRHREHHDDDHHSKGLFGQGDNKNRKKRSFLSDIFDF